MKNFSLDIVIVVFLSFLFSVESFAQKENIFKNVFLDSLDNSIDISEFLRTRYGFAFVPALITEPAIGYGGGGALLFIHRNPKEIIEGTKGFPSISVLGGFYTQSNSWAVGGGHLGVWKNGNIRYRGGVGIISANLTYYRTPLLPNGVKHLDFNIAAYGLLQEITFRLWNSAFFAGINYSFGHTEVKFKSAINLPEILNDELNLNIGGFGASLYYDSRNNMFTPNTGIYAGIKYIHYDKYFGSDKKFGRFFSHILGYIKLTNKIFGALRLDYKNSFDNTPFFMRPFIDLRGVPAMRYQGETTYLAETEIRWDFTNRWSLIGFTGYGEALPVNKSLFNRYTAYNYGAGFRYLLARLYGIRMGIDIAKGPKDCAFYIQFGSSWFRY